MSLFLVVEHSVINRHTETSKVIDIHLSIVFGCQDASTARPFLIRPLPARRKISALADPRLGAGHSKFESGAHQIGFAI